MFTMAAVPTTPTAVAAAASKGHVHATAAQPVGTPPPTAPRAARALSRRLASWASRRPKITLVSARRRTSSRRRAPPAFAAAFASVLPTSRKLCTPHAAPAAAGSTARPGVMSHAAAPPAAPSTTQHTPPARQPASAAAPPRRRRRLRLRRLSASLVPTHPDGGDGSCARRDLPCRVPCLTPRRITRASRAPRQHTTPC